MIPYCLKSCIPGLKSRIPERPRDQEQGIVSSPVIYPIICIVKVNVYPHMQWYHSFSILSRCFARFMFRGLRILCLEGLGIFNLEAMAAAGVRTHCLPDPKSTFFRRSNISKFTHRINLPDQKRIFAENSHYHIDDSEFSHIIELKRMEGSGPMHACLYCGRAKNPVCSCSGESAVFLRDRHNADRAYAARQQGKTDHAAGPG